MKVSRRTVARLVAGAPVAAIAAPLAGLESLLGVGAARAQQAPESGPSPTPEETDSPLGRFLARQEDGLSGEERRRVRREVAQLEQGLKTVRDFKVTNDVPPSGTFRAIRARRSHAQ